MNKNNSSGKAPKIIWAVQPFSNEKTILQSAAWCLRALVKSEPAQIDPVFVWPASPTEGPGSGDASTLQMIQKEGNEELEAVLTRIKVPGIQPLRVLAKNSATVTQEAKALLDHAKEQNAELLVLTSHGRKGLKRLFLGSFAETLTLYSSVPLLIVHPGWKRIPEFKKILFPTDFSPESLEAFSRVLEFAEQRKSRVVLFHKVRSAIYPTFDFAFEAQSYYQQAIEEELVANEKVAKEWARQAKKRGIRVDVIIDRKGAHSVSEAILQHSKRLGCNMIALASRSGPVSSVLMGSIARQIVRSADLPVWVIHSSLKSSLKLNLKNEKGRPFLTFSEEDLEADLIDHGRDQSA